MARKKTDPSTEDTKGGVRGTHGLGDAPRRSPGDRPSPDEHEAHVGDRKERGLETKPTHGPGPNDYGAGRARTKHLEDAGLRPKP
jgi:hypothetical protein